MKNRLYPVSKKSIFLATHTRVDLLDNCLSSIKSANNFSEYNFFIIFQGNNAETEAVLKRHNEVISKIIKVPGVSIDPIANINFNRIMGYRYAFEDLNSDFAVAIEDDVEIAKDSLMFIESMVARYGHDPKFGCINLMSTGVRSNQEFGYSKFRASLIGNGSAITKKTWEKLNSVQFNRRFELEPFDGAIEDWMKCKFCIFPNRSRILDFGWSGTHQSDPNSTHFQVNRISWIGELCVKSEYVFDQEEHILRGDWRPFKRRESAYFRLRKLALELNRSVTGHKIITAYRKIVGLSAIPRLP